MIEQTGGTGEVVVDDGDVAVKAGEEADVADVGNKKTRSKKNFPCWVSQYLDQPGLTPEQVKARREQLRKDFQFEV